MNVRLAILAHRHVIYPHPTATRNSPKKCFTKCITKPGGALSGSDEKCLSNCMQQYLSAYDIVNAAYVSRLRKERLDQQASLEQQSSL
ncbi:uncharacterized protein TRAVEDRAFT_48851 [Trametes versicolor FP-101664 SS1]|uniref:uncharacterized protein n=1 Tax=Trametes versicolor (strain FP-101664) TaxID=717944 RepID=UPI000462149A|nr:uncharacterized protein TRAVEDRAFT_48851 [Trametes versicolor FP-101664 SS1]EIW57822.1 hypothetical protein TRAVEDRAFT_48851 [Trametes versicolor FP-101664 SS1]